MAAISIQSVLGKIKPEKLGRTLMHEHVMVGYPGADADWLRPGPTKREKRKIAADKIAEMKDEGIKSMIDPCPADLGRDIEFIAEVAQKSKFNIVAATGLYHEHEGGSPHWKSRTAFGGPQENAMADLMIAELTDGVGKTGIKAGIIKVATSAGMITDYEKVVLTAAAKASVATGAPITTHTDRGTMGPDQQQFLVEQGRPPAPDHHRPLLRHERSRLPHEDHPRRLVHGLRPLRPRRDPPRQRARVVALEADQEGRDLADRGLARHGLVLEGRADRGPEAPRPRWRRSGPRRTSRAGSSRACSPAARPRKTSTS